MNWIYVILLVVSGGIGGFIAAIRKPMDNPIKLPFMNKTLNLGILGDIFIGMASSLVAFTIFGIMPTNDIKDTTLTTELGLKLLGFGLIAGYAGIKVLEKAAINLLQSKQEEISKSITINSKISEGRDFLSRNKYELAIHAFQQALEIDPNDEEANIGLATARNYFNEHDYIEPIKILDKVISNNPRSAKAFYNRACIKALNLQNFTIKSIIDDIDASIKISSIYKDTAKLDKDFESIYKTSEFQKIIGTIP